MKVLEFLINMGILEIVLLLLIIILLLYKWVQPVLPVGFPPGPRNYPIIGGSRAVSKLNPTTAIAYNELGKTYGPLTALYFRNHLGLIVNSFDGIMEVLTRDEFNGRPSGFNVFIKPVVPSANQTGIIFNNNEPCWKAQRKITIQSIQHLLTPESKFEEVIQNEVKIFLDGIKIKVKDDKASIDGISMEGLFKRPVINVLWAALTGNRPKLDELKSVALEEIALGFRTPNRFLLPICQYPFIRIVPYFENIWQRQAGNQAMIRKFIETSVEQHRVDEVTQSTPNQGYVDFISAYLNKMSPREAVYNGDSPYNQQQLIETCNDLFAAGAETTSNYLAFSMLYMLLYPKVQEKVQTEIDTIVGRGRFPLLKDLEKLPYTQAVASEILRINCPAPISAPHANLKETDLRGFKIPKNTILMLNFYSIHMDKEHWGDPDNFRPERFLDGQGNFVQSERVISFGFGKRACPGQELAKTIFYLFFTGMMQTWRIQPLPATLRPSTVPLPGLTMSPQPFKVILKHRPRM